MNLIVCVDTGLGMAFNRRRQSSDIALVKRIAETVGGGRLWVAPYSEKLFGNIVQNLSVSRDFLQKAEKGDWCFCEINDASPIIEKCEKIIVYNWNRAYPSDLKFPRSVLLKNKSRIACSEFSGNSHEIITEEIYL